MRFAVVKAGDIQNRVHGLVSSFNMARAYPSWVVARAAAVGSVILPAIALSGCSFNDGISPYITDPGRYSAYHCKNLTDRLKYLTNREQELRDLINRASESTGGAVIGALAYRADLEKVVGDQKVLRRTAADKKCEVDPATFQSDQIVR